MTPSFRERLEGKKPLFMDRITTDKNGCWIWTGTISANGYGKFHLRMGNKSKNLLVHRAIYLLLVGDIPKGKQLDHLCRVRHCVNPKHLEVVTNRENTLRGVGITAINARKTHCHLGHPLSGENLKRVKNWRSCRICHRKTVSDSKLRQAILNEIGEDND